ncbi:hypothetical protein JCM15519_01450 [Fundidesulfovibrio butyratiphilus]
MPHRPFPHIDVAAIWRALSIGRKIGLIFSSLLLFTMISFLVDVGSLFLVQNAESEILNAMEIRQKIFEMDGELEKARRLYWDFLLNYQELGFDRAQKLFGNPARDSIARVIEANGELKELIATPGVNNALRRHQADINLYLSLTRRFSDVLRYNFGLLTALASPGTGFEARLDKAMSTLLGAIASAPDLSAMAFNVKMHEMHYRISRQRPFMQSGLNALDRLQHALLDSKALDEEQKRKALASLDEYKDFAAQILSTDVTLRSLRNDFNLQVKTLTPVSDGLKSLATAEVIKFRDKIDFIVRAATTVVLITAAFCFLAALAASGFVRSTITGRILALTKCASELRSGNLEAAVRVDSGDELGVLADTFNDMTHRMKDLVVNLEDKVRQRTNELSLKNMELDEKNRTLAILSMTDRLTGLCNRRKIDEALRMELRRVKRYGGMFSLILTDLDHFKRVNDTFGHSEGDNVLLRIADILTGLARETDIVGRWGGEEFLIVCPETGENAAQVFAERLRLEIAETGFSVVGSMTASFGVTISRPGDDQQTILQRADRALYLAKNGGRNRVAHA